MRLNPKDGFKIRILKEKYGYSKTSELVRYLINRDIDKMLETRPLKERYTVDRSQSQIAPGNPDA
jgi:hypothetical protein